MMCFLCFVSMWGYLQEVDTVFNAIAVPRATSLSNTIKKGRLARREVDIFIL